MNTNQIHAERVARFKTAGLYLVTSQTLSAGRSTIEIIKAALTAGVSLIQLREKDMPTREQYRLAVRARKLTADAGALLLINDRLDLALAVGADGVHLGQDDLPPATARRLAPDMLIGTSTHSLPEIRRAEKDGASYINIGPIFPTKTKDWQGRFLGLTGLRRLARSTRLPFTVMGGIKTGHIPELTDAGARIIAMVTAVTAAPDPEQAARDMLALIKTCRYHSNSQESELLWLN